MKRRGAPSCLFLLALSLPIVPALAARPNSAEGWTVFLSGDADGYLSPCGCTSPMQGGMKRRATVLRSDDPHTVRLDNGGLVGDPVGRQALLKAQTAAQALDDSKIDAANLNARDARLGEDKVLGLVNLSKNRFVSTSLRPSSTLLVDPWRVAGPFLVGGATARPEALAAGLREAADPPASAARRLVAEAEGRGLAPLLLFDGDHEAARALAREVPALRLVTYRMTGHPASQLERVGDCALATPGERGKTVIRLSWQGGSFVASSVRTLDPEIPDDAGAKTLYDAYLREVTREGLLDALPHEAKGFAGSDRCLKCHAQAARVWEASSHFHALGTLEKEGHGRDPECVPCHVVGTAQGPLRLPELAFRSRAKTPNLAEVGCESCHGAGAAHVASPHRFALKPIGEATCRPCHSLENSPNFDFAKYWARIRH